VYFVKHISCKGTLPKIIHSLFCTLLMVTFYGLRCVVSSFHALVFSCIYRSRIIGDLYGWFKCGLPVVPLALGDTDRLYIAYAFCKGRHR
jgi:hypothetical protein